VESPSEDARNENACMWQALWLQCTLPRAYLHLPTKPMHPLYIYIYLSAGRQGISTIHIGGLRRGGYKLPRIVHCPANSNLCEYTCVCGCVYVCVRAHCNTHFIVVKNVSIFNFECIFAWALPTCQLFSIKISNVPYFPAGAYRQRNFIVSVCSWSPGTGSWINPNNIPRQIHFFLALKPNFTTKKKIMFYYDKTHPTTIRYHGLRWAT